MKWGRSRTFGGNGLLTIIRDNGESYFQQLKKQIVSQIYFGKLAPGDRLPATRRLARQLGVNEKTIAKIYLRLQHEGYLTVAPRSGATVRPQAKADRSLTVGAMQLAFVRKILQEGSRLGLSPEKFSELIRNYTNPVRRGELTAIVVECNREQLLCFSHEIEAALKIAAYPVLLSELAAPKPEILDRIRASQCFVTTHYHWDEVSSHARSFGRPTVEIRLNPRFFDGIVERARVEPVGMIVTDLAFVAGFRKALRKIDSGLGARRLLSAVTSNPDAVRRVLERVRTVFVSPPCQDLVTRFVGSRKIAIVPFGNMVATESLETLETCLFMVSRPPHESRRANAFIVERETRAGRSTSA
jgi:DNA-binding transcriptional regulator YhcF (GntR family)